MSEFKKRLLKKCKRGVYDGEEISYLERMKTGIAGLDCAIGGGLPIGRVLQIWGPESTGKSALCLSMIKGRQEINPDSFAFYVDAEMTVTQEDLDVHNIDKKRMLFYRPLGGEDAIDAALEALLEGAEIAVVDSVPYLRPKRVLDELLKDSSYRDVSSIALLLERVQSKIIITLEQSEGCLIFINQQRPPKDIYKGATHPGGSALNFMLSISMNIYSAKKDRQNPHMLTQNILVNKNKTYTPLKKTSLLLNNRVVDRIDSLVNTCVESGLIITKGGGYLSLAEDVAQELGVETALPRSVDKATTHFRENPELSSKLYDLLMTRVSAGAVSSLDMEMTEEEANSIYNE